METIKKVIVIDDCLKCPNWTKCKPSKALTSKERLTVTIGVGVGKFILKGCPLDDLKTEKIQHVGMLMTWNDAIDYAYHKGMYIPNERQCDELGLHKCWTSTTATQKFSDPGIINQPIPNYAVVAGELNPRNKCNDLQPVIMVGGSNYTLGVIAYKTGDEGDGTTKVD